MNTYLFTSGKLRRNEKSLSNADKSKVSINKGSFCGIFDPVIPISNSVLSPASPKGYVAELLFFNRAVVNPAAHT